MKTGIKHVHVSLLFYSFFWRLALFTAGWVILLGGKIPGDLWMVTLFLIATTLISIYSVRPGQWLFRPLPVLRFFFYFLLMALRGGWDVARRVFLRIVPTDPDFVTIKHKRDPLKTLILAWVISLLPGTASCVIKKKTIVVHVLDKNLPFKKEIKELQTRIDAMFVNNNF
ncbi:MAG: Na+/H+ antiporter subunit E [Cyclobacteriaceae bacterium]|nr:Na+/H+ antiporter subunit E [Cyclobacteriaceae bacterium]